MVHTGGLGMVTDVSLGPEGVSSPPHHHLRCDVIISNVIIFADMLSSLYTAQLEWGIHRKCKCHLAKTLLSMDSSCLQ